VDNQPKRLQATALLLGAVLAISGLFAAAYFLYPLQLEPRLVKRDYRMLAAIADQVGKRIEGLSRAVQTAQDDPNSNSPCQHPYVPGLKCVGGGDLPAELRPAPGSCTWDVQVHVHSDSGELNADFLARRGPKPEAECTAAEASFLYLQTNLGRFLEEVIEPYGYFDTVLLASEEGKVLYQSDVPIVDGRALYHSRISTGRIAAIRDLMAAEQAAEQKDGSGNETAKQSAMASYVFSPSRYEKVQYLGEEYLLFAQPVSSHVFVADSDGQEHSTTLVLFGLVSSRSFGAETRQLPWVWLGVLVFLLVLTFLSWPLLRLWRMGPGEPLRGADVRMIPFAFIAAAMVITFFVLDLTFYASISRRFDELLERLARHIDHRLKTEIVNADQQLTEVLNEAGCKSCCPARPLISVKPGAYFADLILADSTGHPTCRWYSQPDDKQEAWRLIRADKPPQIALADRSYFREARGRVLWNLADKESGGGIWQVAVDVVSSRISGDDVLVVAGPAGAAGSEGSHGQQCPKSSPSEQRCQPAVGMIATKMMPFAHPVLPMGYGFAIVNDQGDVQIHSLASRNKRENLFRECDDATGVRAAVGTRMPALLDVSYSGHDYRIFVTPLSNTPWSLVVFRDKQLLWAANSEIISSWAMLTLLYLVVWIVAAIVLQVCDSSYTAHWLWPCRWGGGARSYWLVAAQTVVLAAIAYLSLRRVEDLGPLLGRYAPLIVHFGMVLIFPALTVGLACLTLAASDALSYWEKTISAAVTIAGGIAAGIFVALLIVIFVKFQTPLNYQVPALAPLLALLGALILINLRGQRAVPRRGAPPVSLAGKEAETGFRFAYVSMLFSLVVALAVVPSIVFFQTASDMEVTNLFRMAQTRWVESLVTRAQQLRAETTVEVTSRIFGSRFDDMKDIYPVDWFPAPIKWQDTGPDRETDASEARAHVLLIAELLNGLGLPEFSPLMSFAAELRMMTSVSDTRKRSPYTWTETGRGAEVMTVHDDSLRYLLDRSPIWDQLGLPGAPEPGSSPPFVRRGFPCFGARHCWSIIAGMALGAIFAAFAVFAALWTIACKLFLLDADLEGDESSAPAPVDLSKEEKLALWHLVRLGFLSPGDSATACVLFRRGVLFRNPALDVREAEYKQIRQLDNTEMLAREREAQPPVSSRLHRLLLPVIALAMIFLFLTQRDLFNSAVAVIAALAAALPTVLKFFSQLGGSPEKN
jgi:hypothetical protein